MRRTAVGAAELDDARLVAQAIFNACAEARFKSVRIALPWIKSLSLC
jgi:hypothetical protein